MFYSYSRFSDDIELMTGQRPNYYWLIMWKYVSPIVIIIIFFASLIKSMMSAATYEAWIPSIVSETVTTFLVLYFLNNTFCFEFKKKKLLYFAKILQNRGFFSFQKKFFLLKYKKKKKNVEDFNFIQPFSYETIADLRSLKIFRIMFWLLV